MFNFEADNEREIGWHMGKQHGLDESMDISASNPKNCEKCNYEVEDMKDYHAHRRSEQATCSDESPDTIACIFCDERFTIKGDLMRHKKNVHTEKVSICWKFSSGNCPFEVQKRWFIHSNDIKSTEFNCNICEKSVVTLPDFRVHKKRSHLQEV